MTGHLGQKNRKKRAPHYSDATWGEQGKGHGIKALKTLIFQGF
jgi:hypothetical protein